MSLKECVQLHYFPFYYTVAMSVMSWLLWIKNPQSISIETRLKTRVRRWKVVWSCSVAPIFSCWQLHSDLLLLILWISRGRSLWLKPRKSILSCFLTTLKPWVGIRPRWPQLTRRILFTSSQHHLFTSDVCCCCCCCTNDVYLMYPCLTCFWSFYGSTEGNCFNLCFWWLW